MSDFEKEIYTSLEEAKEEIWKRWENKTLREKVTEFMGDVPPAFSKSPGAVLGRHIISPNNELLYFGKQSACINLKPVCIEYLHDKFCAMNGDKLYLAKMPFLRGQDKYGEVLFQYRKITDIKKYEGEDICDVETTWGEHLIDFHHRILSNIHSDIEFFDVSSWYKSNGGSAAIYYQKFLMLFVCHGVLFENFVTNAEEQRFAEEVVYPAFKEVEQLFGLKPLIVPLLPPHNASDKYWFCYSEDVEKEVLRCLDSCKR
jgi:hypothetical protein